jgi:hypothetical protein
MNRPVVAEPAAGWALDEKRLAHMVRCREPVVHRAWCGKALYGPIVQHIAESTRRCGACPREKQRIEVRDTQGRLFW